MTRARRRTTPLRALALGALALVLATAPALAQTKAERMEALVSKYHEYGLFNGSVLVAEDGKPAYEGGFGDAVMEWDVPNTPDTKFRIGSVTKQFTAALVLQQVEDGKMDLQAHVTDYIPEYPADKGDRITIHELLTHTSGIPSYTEFPDFQEWVRDPFTPDSFVKIFWNKPLDFEPGTRWSYSNSGYFLLGAILERVTGEPYDRLLRERILDPLGLHDTGYDHYTDVIEHMASGYAKVGGEYRNAAYLDTSIPYSAGSLYSTVEDLLRWDQALYGKGPFRDAATKELYFRPYADAGPNVKYAYGWDVREVPMGADTVHAIEHGGGIFGFTTAFWRFPDQHRTVIVMDNTGSRFTDDLARDLARVLYGQPVEEPKRPIADVLAGIIEERGVDAAIARYRELKETASDEYDFGEGQLNTLGYRYLNAGDADTAIAIFRLNAEMFPDAWNPWDSLAEGYLEAGDREKAIEYYRKSLKLNPGNDNAKRMLRERLGVEAGDTAAKVPEEVLRRYVGSYELRPGLVLDVTLEEGSLHGRATGQPKVDLVPVSTTRFAVQGVGATIDFDASGDGPAPSLTLHQAGHDVVAPRVEE